MKKIFVSIFAVFLIMGFSKVAYATWGPYNVIVPVTGGINTNTVTKVDGSAPYGYNDNSSVGGGYTLYSYLCRQDTGSKVTDTDYFTSGGWSKMSFAGAQSWYYGYPLYMHIYSGSNCWVKVQAIGSWTPDSY